MYKISIGVLCLSLALIFGNAMVVSGESDDETISVPLGVIPLGPPEDVEAKRPPVPFPHGTHFVYTCSTCHHLWEMDAPIALATGPFLSRKICATPEISSGIITLPPPTSTRLTLPELVFILSIASSVISAIFL